MRDLLAKALVVPEGTARSWGREYLWKSLLYRMSPGSESAIPKDVWSRRASMGHFKGDRDWETSQGSPVECFQVRWIRYRFALRDYL